MITTKKPPSPTGGFSFCIGNAESLSLGKILKAMIVSEIALYNVLKTKMGEAEAQTVVEGIKQEIKNEFNANKDILATKKDVSEIRLEIEKLRAEFMVVKWMLGVVLAGIISLILKTFFT